RLHRQQHEIAFLPVLALAFHDRITLALEHVDDEPALVAMLARARLDVMDKHAPLLQRRILERHRIEKVPELTLTRLEPFLLGAVDDHGSGEIALGERLALRHHALIGIVLERRPLALAHAFDFSHLFAPSCYLLVILPARPADIRARPRAARNHSRDRPSRLRASSARLQRTWRDCWNRR